MSEKWRTPGGAQPSGARVPLHQVLQESRSSGKPSGKPLRRQPPCRHGDDRRLVRVIFEVLRPVELMNATSRKPTTGTPQCRTLCNKWHGIFYMPSRTDTAGHTKAFIYPVTQTRLDIPRPLITQSHIHGWTYQDLSLPSLGPLGGRQSAPAQGGFRRLVSLRV